MEAAKVWVVAADAPRFLQPLAKWLNGHGWLKVPPTRRQQRQRRGMSMGDYMREAIQVEQPPIIRYETFEVVS
jgi:hypothetical protein